MVVHFRQTASQKRLHDYSRNLALSQFVIQIFRIRIPLVDFLGMPPVQIVQLYLHKIPLILVVP